MKHHIKVKSKEFFILLDVQNVMYCIECMAPDKLDSDDLRVRTNWECSVIFLADWAHLFFGRGFTTLEPKKFLKKYKKVIISKKYKKFCLENWSFKSSDSRKWATSNIMKIYYYFIEQVWHEHLEDTLFGLDEKYAWKAARRIGAIEAKYM